MSNQAISLRNIEQGTLLIDIATRNVIRLAPGDSVGEAVRIMTEKRISSIVVTDRGGHPLGIVTEHNMLRAMRSICPTETALREVMSSPVITVPASITCLDAYQVCLRDGIRHLVIVSEDKLLLGVVSETDFRQHINLSVLAGRRQVASVMSRSVFTQSPEASLRDALDLMESHKDTCVVAVEAGRPVGIVTERDIVRLYSGNPERINIPIREVMSSPVLAVSQESSINDAAEQMLTAKVRHLVVVDHEGKMAGLLSEHDLTHTMALRLIDDKLISDGAFLHTLVKTIPDMIWLKDVNGVYMACNPRFERFFGAKEKDIIGKTDYDFVDKESADSFREYDSKAMEKDGPSINEERIFYADDGHSELLETLKTPMRDSQGKLIGVLGIARDITARKLAEQAFLESECKLREQKEFLTSILESSLDAFVLMNSEGVIISWCNQAEKMFGWKQEEAIGRLMHETIVPSRYRDRHVQGVRHFLSTGEGPVLNTRTELFALHRDGREFPVELSISPVKTAGSFEFSSFVRDISERKRAEENLRITASVFDNSQEAIMINDADNNIIDVNQAFTRITGYSREEVLGRNPKLLNSGRQDQAFYGVMWQSLNREKVWRGEIWNRRKSGEVYAQQLSISAICDNDGDKVLRYVAVFSDISHIKKHEKQLEYIAYYDPLTGLPNRVLLADRLHQAMTQAQRSGQQLAVAFLDLDGFKSINDNHGHEAGDQLLITVAVRMKQALREGDTLARLGGDEFIAVLLDLEDAEASVPMLTRLLAAAAQSVHVGDLALQVSASLGVTFYPQIEDMDADQLLRQADQAMYQAKLAGKNRYHVFDAALNSNIRSHHESLDRIRLALTEHEFVLYYQPKVNMRTGTVIGAEALIRWQHPGKCLLSPSVFLPEIEDHPLAIDIGDWVIDTALAQIELWHAAGLNIPVSVNVGARQLQQPDFVERLHTLLAAHPAIRPGDLELEVLETSALDDVAGISHVIEACRKMGVNFALDDFGTGYSSLTYLRRLPVTLLKIDQSFVHDMLDDPDDLAIIEGVIGLARTFRRQVIAEGVETVEHGTMLLQLGCELAQGYGIARPMPAHQLPSWSATWQPDPAWIDQPSMSRDNLPLLFAGVEQRSWIAAIEAFLKGERDAPLALDPEQSRFGMWMNTESLANHNAQPAFEAIDSLHRQIQTLSTELCELQILGRNSEALARLDELHDLRDALLNQLKVPTQETR